jgi:hypothetical protein
LKGKGEEVAGWGGTSCRLAVEEELAGFFWRGRSCNGDLDEGKEIWRRDGEEEERKEREGSVQLYKER